MTVTTLKMNAPAMRMKNVKKMKTMMFSKLKLKLKLTLI